MALNKIIGLIVGFYAALHSQDPALPTLHLITATFITLATPIIGLYVYLTTTEPLLLVILAVVIAWVITIPMILIIITVSYFAAAGSAGHYGH